MSGSSNHEAFWVIGGAGLAIVAIILWSAREDARRDYEQSRPAAAAPAPSPSGWRTRPITDPMGGAGGQIACTLSTNSIALQWPYGEVRAEVCFRRTARQGFDAMIQIQPDAIIVCHTNNCPIEVRIDEGPIRTYAGADTTSGSSNLAFFENPTRLQRAMAGSNRAKIELTIHDHGPAVFSFATADMPAI